VASLNSSISVGSRLGPNPTIPIIESSLLPHASKINYKLDKLDNKLENHKCRINNGKIFFIIVDIKL
jgi:hypothetical protein